MSLHLTKSDEESGEFVSKSSNYANYLISLEMEFVSRLTPYAPDFVTRAYHVCYTTNEDAYIF